MEREVKTGSEERHEQAEKRKTADRRFDESQPRTGREREREFHILLMSLTHSLTLERFCLFMLQVELM